MYKTAINFLDSSNNKINIRYLFPHSIHTRKIAESGKLISLLLIFILFPFRITANGDPTDELSALNRSANPTPRNITDIHIIREELRIKPGIYSSISVKYILWNASDKDYTDIDYGFPVDYQGTGDKYINSPLIGENYSDARFTMGWHDNYIRNVSFFANGQLLPYEASPETILEKPVIKQEEDLIRTFGKWSEAENDFYNDLASIGRRWFYTRFSIPAGSTLTLEVNYTLRNSHYKAGFSKTIQISDGTREGCSLHYDLAPAVYWGNGKARDFTVEIDISDISIAEWGKNTPDDYYLKSGIYGLPFIQEGNKLLFSTRNFDFKDADPIFMTYRPNPTPELSEILSHRISNERYTITVSDALSNHPATLLADMDLETAWAAKTKPGRKGMENITGDTITIKFHKPTKLGAIILLGGYHKNKDTYFRNNRPKWIWAILHGMGKKYVDGIGWTELIEKEIDIHDMRILDKNDETYKTVYFDNLTEHSMIYERGPGSEEVTKIEFWIREWYPGTHHDDICVSEIILLDEGIFPQ